jgi:hypothetical protein
MKERKKEKFWQDLNMQLVMTYKPLDCKLIHAMLNDFIFIFKVGQNYIKKTKNWGYYFGQLKYFDNE